jgi:hypothetical protein
VVGFLSAVDPEGDLLEYHVAAPLGACPVSLWTNGTLVFNASVGAANHEAQPTCTLTAQVCEDATPDRFCGNATIVVTLNITDVNEAPAFVGASLALTVSERAPEGYRVGTLAFTDPDAGDSGTVTLVTGAVSQAPGPFTLLANGSLVLTGPLDAEVKSGYLFWARVSDARGLSVDGLVNVTVTDASDAPVLQCGVDPTVGGVEARVVEHALGVLTPLAVVVTEQDSGRPVSVVTLSSSSVGVAASLVPVLLSRPSSELPNHVQR